MLKEFFSFAALLRRGALLLFVYLSFHAVPLEIKAIQKYRDVAKWPTTEAVILSARVSATSFSWSHRESRFCPDLEYSYSVAGEAFTSRNRLFDFACWPEGSRFVAEHQRGSTIQIAYDPSNPSVTVVPGNLVAPGYPWVELIGGMFFLVLLLGDIALVRRKPTEMSSRGREVSG